MLYGEKHPYGFRDTSQTQTDDFPGLFLFELLALECFCASPAGIYDIIRYIIR